MKDFIALLRNPWVIAGLIGLAAMMEMLDMTIVNVSLQTMAGELSAGPDEVSWVITSYLVANAIVVPISGWLSTVFGRKRFFLGCVGTFTLCSLLCGLAPGLRSLIFFRVLQGLAGGGLGPTAQVVLTDAFPPEKRASAMAIYFIAMILGPGLGPTLGGLITDSLNWRWVFLVNVPVGVVLGGLIFLAIRDPRYVTVDRLRRLRAGIKIDYLGFLLLTVGVGCLQIMLDKGQEDDWLQSNFICTVATISFLCLSCFVIWEIGHKEPIVDLTLLGNRNFLFCTILVAMLGFMIMGTTLLLPQLLQTQFGYTALQSGLTLSAAPALSLVMTVIVARTSGRFDPRLVLAVGASLSAIGIYMMSRISPDASWGTFVAARIMQMMWMPLLFVPSNMLAFAAMRREDFGSGAALMGLARGVGSSLGLSAVVTYLSRMRQVHETFLAAGVTHAAVGYHDLTGRVAGLAPHFHGPMLGRMTDMIAGQMVEAQANLLAYLDSFRLVALLFVLPLPALIFLRVPKRGAAPPARH